MRYAALTLIFMISCANETPMTPTAVPEDGPAVLTTTTAESRADTCVYDTFGDQQQNKDVCLWLGGNYRNVKQTPNSISTGICKLPFPGVEFSNFKLRHPNRQQGCLGS